MDITLSAPSFCRQISPEEFEYQRAYGSQEPLAALLEEVITDAKLSRKEKKKKLKQVKGIFFLFFSLLIKVGVFIPHFPLTTPTHALIPSHPPPVSVSIG